MLENLEHFSDKCWR